MVNFTKNNPALAPLFTISYPTDYFPLKNANLPRSLKVEGAIIYEALFGTEQSPDDYTLLLKSQDGELQKFYGPSVGKSPNGDTLAIKWGEKFIDLQLDGANIVPRELNNGLKFESMAISEGDFGYKEKETALVIVLESDEGYYDLELPIRFKDVKGALKYTAFKTLLKKDAAKACELLAEVYEGTATGGGGGSTIEKLTDLPEGTSLTINGYENYAFTTKKGEELERVLLVSDTGTKYWSPDTLDKVVHLLEMPLVLSLDKYTKSAKGNFYIDTARVIINDTVTLTIGGSVKAVPEKMLPEGKYTLWGVDSFVNGSGGKSFISYIYTIQDEDGTFYKSFAPSKHRTVLSSEPLINADNPASFEIFRSGADNPSDFTVSQLKATFEIDSDSIDLDNLF